MSQQYFLLEESPNGKTNVKEQWDLLKISKIMFSLF